MVKLNFPDSVPEFIAKFGAGKEFVKFKKQTGVQENYWANYISSCSDCTVPTIACTKPLLTLTRYVGIFFFFFENSNRSAGGPEQIPALVVHSVACIPDKQCAVHRRNSLEVCTNIWCNSGAYKAMLSENGRIPCRWHIPDSVFQGWKFN